MNVDTRGPYTIDRIHYFTTERGHQVRSLTLRDGEGNEIGMRFPNVNDLRIAASAFPLAENVSLSLVLGERAVWDHDLIRRWIRGEDLAFAGPGAAVPMQAGVAE